MEEARPAYRIMLVCRCKHDRTQDMQACISPGSSQADTLALEEHALPDDVSDVLDGSFGAQPFTNT